MSSNSLTCHLSSCLIGTVAFVLPLTLLIPDFSVWDVMPKVRVSRFLIICQHISWNQLNLALVFFTAIFFCFFLEIRKRKLDDMVENLMAVSHVAEKTMEVERLRQMAAVRACVKLIDSSTEHFENLMLLRDELRKRTEPQFQHPPTISSSSFM